MKNLIFTLLLIFSGNIFAQHSDMLTSAEPILFEEKPNERKEKKKLEMKVNRANDLYDRLGFMAAKEILEEIDSKNLDESTLEKLATAYRMNHQPVEAEYYYSKLIQHNSNKPEYLLRYAQALQSNGKCEDAIRWFKKFEKVAGNKSHEWEFQVDCDEVFAYAWHPEVSNKNFKELNSKYLDFSPVAYKNNLIITSNRKWKTSVKRSDLWTKDNFTDMFLAEMSGKNKVSSIKLLRNGLAKKYHDGAPAILAGGEKLYFTRNNENGRNEKGEIDLKIYETESTNGQWQVARALSFNGEEFSTAHPSLSPDGFSMVFSSNRPGGFGGMDLYITHLKGGQWSEPASLGPEINSAGNEVFPHWAKDGKLYFSSEGHNGLGGLDVFVISKKEVDGKLYWSDRIHLGTPLNSEMDDFSFSINEGGESGFFSSDRKGGMGGDDIYRWTAPGGLKFFDTKNAIVRDLSNGVKLSDVAVTYKANRMVGERLSSAHPAKVRKDFEIPKLLTKYKELITNADGIVQMKIHPDMEYSFHVHHPGYLPFEVNIDAKEFFGEGDVYLDLIPIPLEKVVHDYVVVEKEVPVVREIIKECDLEEGVTFTLENIFYDYNKWNIREDASVDLSALYALLKKYPEMHIQLEAHTDSRGTDKYNMKLSEKRVASAMQFLIDKGINFARLKTAHFGESILVNECGNGIECTEEKHQANRRTEVRITKFPYELKK